MSNIVIILGGVTLPTPDLPFTRPIQPNETDVTTLDGTLYTDFVNYRRVWKMTWAQLTADEFEAIEDLFKAQYSTEVYPILDIAYYDVYAPVKMQINDKSIRQDGCYIIGLEVTLTEQYAIS